MIPQSPWLTLPLAVVSLVAAGAFTVAHADETTGPTPTPSPSPSESISLGPAPSTPAEPTQTPEVGEAAQAKRETTRTCRFVTTRTYEKVGDSPWRLVDVERRPTGRDCTPEPVEVPTVIAGGL